MPLHFQSYQRMSLVRIFPSFLSILLALSLFFTSLVPFLFPFSIFIQLTIKNLKEYFFPQEASSIYFFFFYVYTWTAQMRRMNEGEWRENKLSSYQDLFASLQQCISEYNKTFFLCKIFYSNQQKSETIWLCFEFTIHFWHWLHVFFCAN